MDSEQVTFKRRLEGEDVKECGVETVPGTENSECKGPKARRSIA